MATYTDQADTTINFRRTMRTRLITLVLSCFCIGCSWAQAAMQYTLRFPKPESRYVEVRLQLTAPSDTVTLGLPVWTPGSYLIREFSRNLDGFAAFAGGQGISAYKTAKNTWEVPTRKGTPLEIRYRVYCNEYSVRTSYIDDAQAALVGTTYLLFEPRLMQQRHEIRIEPALGWKNIATALPEVDGQLWHRYATDYDELVDCPIQLGNFKSFTFEAAGIPHTMAMPGQDVFPQEKLSTDIRKIVEASAAIFGDQPNARYLFIVQHSAQGGGGLEHAQSTTLQTRPQVYEKEGSYRGFLGLVAHEYFHLWNVKRLRPVALGPFDYNRENYTHHLWISEGFTSYYDNLLLARTRLMPEAEYLKVLSNGFEAVLGNQGDVVQSVAESSLDAWIKFYLRNENSGNISVSYYRKGAMLGMVFDAALLHQSAGQFGLDSVMRFMYHKYHHGLGRGFTDTELEADFRQHLGALADTLFRDYIYGTKPIDFGRFASMAGLILEDTSGRKPMPYLGVSWGRQGDFQVVNALREGSAAWDMGLQHGDALMTINGEKVEDADKWLRTHKLGEKLKIKVLRQGKEVELRGKIGSYPAPQFHLYKNKQATALQKTNYEKLVGYPF